MSRSNPHPRCSRSREPDAQERPLDSAALSSEPAALEAGSAPGRLRPHQPRTFAVRLASPQPPGECAQRADPVSTMIGRLPRGAASTVSGFAANARGTALLLAAA